MSQPQDIVQAYQEELSRSRAQKKATRSDEKEVTSLPGILEEVQEKAKRSFSRMKLDLNDVVESLENKFLSQYKQLSEIREVVESERRALEELYEIKIPTDSLAALVSLKKERIAGKELELEKAKKEFEEIVRRRKAELDLRQEALQEQQKEFETHLNARHQKSEEELSKKRIELARLEAVIEEKCHTQNTAFEDQKKHLEAQLAQRQQLLESEITEKQLRLGRLESALDEKEKLREFEVQEVRKQLEEEILLKRREWVKEEEDFKFKKIEFEKKLEEMKFRVDEEISQKEKNFWDGLAQERLKWKQDEGVLELRFQEKEKNFEEKVTQLRGLIDTKDLLLRAKETDIEQLKNKAKQLSGNLDQVLSEAKQAYKEKIKLQYDSKIDQMKKEFDQEMHIKTQAISLLNSRIKEQEGLIQELKLRIPRRETPSMFLQTNTALPSVSMFQDPDASVRIEGSPKIVRPMKPPVKRA